MTATRHDVESVDGSVRDFDLMSVSLDWSFLNRLGIPARGDSDSEFSAQLEFSR